jgi:hypothetical protein
MSSDPAACSDEFFSELGCSPSRRFAVAESDCDETNYNDSKRLLIVLLLLRKTIIP